MIAPGRFIEIAEENGSILPIGRWVLREACNQTGIWQREGRTPASMFLSVNVSAREVQQPGFVDGVRGTLREAGVEPNRLVLEITETALLKATPATMSTLGELRDLGVRIVIDDFGTGYFSLSHLRQFSVDALKIASEFVQGGDAQSRSSALAGAIVALGRSLGIETVAEGIETAAQAKRMRDLGCTYGQGHYFGFPLDRPQFEGAIAAESALMPATGSAATTPRRPRVGAVRRTAAVPRLGPGSEVGASPA
jgi:EAL domain-containing protein (putative c-di-GMP-specific phosphodiesterase class I)